MIALLAGMVLTFIGIAVLRLRSTGGTIEYKGVMQIDLGLTAQSDYFDVVRSSGHLPKTAGAPRPVSGNIVRSAIRRTT